MQDPIILSEHRGWLISSGAVDDLMTSVSAQDIADKRALYLTTIGRRTGLPREIEIWFVLYRDRFYLFAETREAAGWVKNIRCNPQLTVRIGEQQISATARVLDREADHELWDKVAEMAKRKYGWGDGLPVEITPADHSNPTSKPAEGRWADRARSA